MQSLAILRWQSPCFEVNTYALEGERCRGLVGRWGDDAGAQWLGLLCDVSCGEVSGWWGAWIAALQYRGWCFGCFADRVLRPHCGAQPVRDSLSSRFAWLWLL